MVKKIGLHGVRVAAINGSLITDDVIQNTDIILESGLPTSTLSDSIVSGEVYLGAAPIVEALKGGAQIVITGRVADPSLFAAPLMYEFGWNEGDYHALGIANGIGHLLECGAQITGGYFADPGFKDIDKPWDLAFPIAEVTNDGTAVITKLDNTGGAVNLQTVKEQLLYEVHDPANYITPDVIVDFSATNLKQVDTNRVEVSGITGKRKRQRSKSPSAAWKAILRGYVFLRWRGRNETSYACRGNLA